MERSIPTNHREDERVKDGRKRGWGEVEHEKMLGGKLNQLRDPGLRGFSFFFLSFLYLFFVHRLALLLPLPSPRHPHGKRLLLFFIEKISFLIDSKRNSTPPGSDLTDKKKLVLTSYNYFY